MSASFGTIDGYISSMKAKQTYQVSNKDLATGLIQTYITALEAKGFSCNFLGGSPEWYSCGKPVSNSVSQWEAKITSHSQPSMILSWDVIIY
jgi:hypothetical protein